MTGQPIEVPDGVTEDVALAVLEAYHWRCAVGGPGCRGRLELHHIKWRSRGGSHLPRNLVPLCRTHHQDEHEGRSNGWSLRSIDPEPDRFPARMTRRIRCRDSSDRRRSRRP